MENLKNTEVTTILNEGEVNNMENILTNTIGNQEVIMEEFFKDAVASTIRSKSRTSGEAGVMSVVKAKTGNRLTLSSELLEKLNNPEIVQITFKADSLVIGEKLPNNESSLNIKRSGGKGIIYNTQLVRDIAERFDLDFSNGKTSITFHEANYGVIDEYPVVVVKIK